MSKCDASRNEQRRNMTAKGQVLAEQLLMKLLTIEAPTTRRVI